MNQKDFAADNDLIAGYLNGNESCLQKLILRHQQKVFTSLMILVKNKQLAEDMFQETFIKVINTLRAGKYNEEGKFLPWVIRIGHNLVIDYFRRQNRMPMLRDTEEYSVMNLLKPADETIEDRMVKDCIHGQVRLLIDSLPFEQREVVIMRHYGEMSFKEIAEITGVSLNTALGRMRYALLNMRRVITEKKLVMSG